MLEQRNITKNNLLESPITGWMIPNKENKAIFDLNHNNPMPSYQKANKQGTAIPGTYVKFPTTTDLPATDRIFDKTTGRQRVIAVRRGATSIWQDDQTKEEISLPVERILFKTSGKLIVDFYDNQMWEFMALTNMNGSNPNRSTEKNPKFFFVDENKQFNKIIEEINLKTEVESYCLTAPFNEVLLMAWGLGVNTDRGENAVRVHMHSMVGADPKMFQARLKNPDTKKRAYMMKAISMNIIAVQDLSIRWGNSNALIYTAPAGTDAVESFITLRTDEANNTFEVIKEFVLAQETPVTTLVTEKKNDSRVQMTWKGEDTPAAQVPQQPFQQTVHTENTPLTAPAAPGVTTQTITPEFLTEIKEAMSLRVILTVPNRINGSYAEKQWAVEAGKTIHTEVGMWFLANPDRLAEMRGLVASAKVRKEAEKAAGKA